MQQSRLRTGLQRKRLSSEEIDRRERRFVEMANQLPGTLEGYDCPICLNRGYTMQVDSRGYRRTAVCSCMEVRKTLRQIEESGLSELMERYTFDRWKCDASWQEAALRLTKQYAEDPQGWLTVCGKPGTGKTHICTAVCSELLHRGIPVRYMLWRDVSTRAKASVNDLEVYERIIEPLKKVPVLYIDDLFKSGIGNAPTAGDCNFAFELINARYIKSGLITIISSEFDMTHLSLIDEALSSRIWERSSSPGLYLEFSGDEMENYRHRSLAAAGPEGGSRAFSS